MGKLATDDRDVGAPLAIGSPVWLSAPRLGMRRDIPRPQTQAQGKAERERSPPECLSNPNFAKTKNEHNLQKEISMYRVVITARTKNGKVLEAIPAAEAIATYVNEKYRLKVDVYLQQFGP